jgi:mono/diheme cytochrome c family protein
MSVQRLSWLGLAATAALITILGLAAINEPARQDSARAELRAEAITRGMDLYALHCAECHGSRGQGDIQEDAEELDSDYMRAREHNYLYDAIARGRIDTDMTAFALDQGGALNAQHIESLMTLIYHGSWEQTAIRVAELGMISPEELVIAAEELARREELVAEAVAAAPTAESPPPAAPDEPGTTADAPGGLPVIEIAPTAETDQTAPGGLPVIEIVPTAETDQAAPGGLPVIAVQPTPDAPPDPRLEQGATRYAIYCAECHGEDGKGTDDAPAVFTAGIAARSIRELRQISFDNPAIEGHDDPFTLDEQSALVYLMQHWMDR